MCVIYNINIFLSNLKLYTFLVVFIDTRESSVRDRTVTARAQAVLLGHHGKLYNIGGNRRKGRDA